MFKVIVAGGDWSTKYQIIGDKLFCESNIPSLKGCELVEVNEQEWRDDNNGYV